MSNSYEDMILKGMKLIKKGCLGKMYCSNCPFTYYCDSIDLAGKPAPEKWDIEEED